MDVLMIGGTRFIGRRVVRKLLDQGDRVTIFSRGNVKPDWWNEVEHIQGDRFETEDFAAKLKGRRFDAVIDSQAFSHIDVKNAITAMQGNVGRYLFVSSGAVYGTQDDWPGKIDWFAMSPFKETDVSWDSLDYDNPVDEFSYAAGKRRGEKWLQESSPTPYTISSYSGDAGRRRQRGAPMVVDTARDGRRTDSNARRKSRHVPMSLRRRRRRRVRQSDQVAQGREPDIPCCRS